METTAPRRRSRFSRITPTRRALFSDTIVVSGITSTAALLNGTSTTNALLQAGTSYWLYGLAEPVLPGFTSSNVQWFGANPLLLAGLRASLTNGSQPWQVTSAGAKEAMAIIGDPGAAPEPISAGLCGWLRRSCC